MGSQTGKKSPRGSSRGYKPPYGKDKDRGHKHESVGESKSEEKHVASLKEISDKTFQQLRVLGSQKFGSSPFSEHFNRWLENLTEVLSEFESNPNTKPDDQYLAERSQILSTIKIELDDRRRKEASIDETAKSQSYNRNLLEKINAEYAAKMREVKVQKNRETRRLNSNIDRVKKKLDAVVRMKTGLFRGVSKKDREQKEIETTQELITAQDELELTILDFTKAQEKIRDEYETKKQPVIEQLRDCQKKIQVLETDGSREDRWFACEALIDAVNGLLQRKTLQPHPPA
jgi:hypothetical protein